ncbi:hypothetical protein [Spirulina major]|uniref:hypothetical protein n=1 Tax=Spirulina major TaxID=270636 RepID=UPI0009343326|nr:hypothetical protein [Spirulina major]
MPLNPFLKRLGPPLAVFLLARLMIAIAALALNLDPLDPVTFSRWDSGHYLHIADQGYELFSCDRIPGYDPEDWCGNTGWLPAYPWLMRLLSVTGLPTITAGVLLSAVFHLATLIALYHYFLDATWNKRNALCLLLAGFFPGCIYYHAVFPISICTFCIVLMLHHLRQQRFLVAGLAGAAAAFTYSTGFVLAAVATAWLVWIGRGQPWRQRVPKLLITPGLTMLGFVLVLVLHHVVVGDWLAFFKVQAKYGHGIHIPIGIFYARIVPIVQPPWVWTQDVQALQTFVVLCFVVAIAVTFFRQRRLLNPQTILLILFMFAFWLFPVITGPGVSSYRAESLLLPSVVLVRYLPWSVQVILTITAVLLAYPMTVLFYQHVLV